MAVGPATLPSMYSVDGIRIGVASAGIKKPGRKDVVVFEVCEDASVAGVFTTNAFCAAPVVISKDHLAQGNVRYFLINTGNANAGTGKQGLADAYECCDLLAAEVGLTRSAVLPFSTGVIGEPLPVAKIAAAIPQAVENLSAYQWEAAASGIMTTDTRPKGATKKIEIDGQTVTISGISKGAGMIMPNMATMLGFIGTDAAVEPQLLQEILTDAANKSFNRITIDGDTSTNDSCMLIATGRSGAIVSSSDTEALNLFVEAINEVMLEIALAIVKDGEGATKLVTVSVESAVTQEEALKTAYTVAHSPLVKTALFASDPNWGRILAAVGRAGIENFDLETLKIYLDDVCIVENGGRAASYTEDAGQAVMNQENILIRIVLNRGDVNETVWTTDLSHEYVTINADYRS
ncbi:bifunctional glutamate N-acetyltransferase/amino-acid acetyltransferase ArgJ [Neptunomonas phycophila]|uniref:bifunctional glutamate N-acetyltransferase/amino-acid acetyltransferase ArgJ n=1 Tax=Neptunomonas phycophila TaxID=1572645 RepID=UPI0026E30CF1|nr:bifunctional glutamate N-acetyltransferase/amino-acid acetyltransferase ArgJ [Neptunomonas phycophila]MDO6782745.1 bifunctional glutamate N-acetyltransferase/amino-acid acetyltransferase ArgJ [Neptunomonas phycophila]